MTRSTTTDFDTASDAEHIQEVIFVELQFASGTSYVCTREHDVDWNGQAWVGRGKVGTIELIEEQGTLEPLGITMTLAVASELLALALDPSEYKNRTARLWQGLLDYSDPAGASVVADPVGPFIFRMDSLAWQIGETGLLQLSAESRLADWQRPRARRYNDVDQQAEWPGDNFFGNAEEMVDATIIW